MQRFEESCTAGAKVECDPFVNLKKSHFWTIMVVTFTSPHIHFAFCVRLFAFKRRFRNIAGPSLGKVGGFHRLQIGLRHAVCWWTPHDRVQSKYYALLYWFLMMCNSVDRGVQISILIWWWLWHDYMLACPSKTDCWYEMEWLTSEKTSSAFPQKQHRKVYSKKCSVK